MFPLNAPVSCFRVSHLPRYLSWSTKGLICQLVFSFESLICHKNFSKFSLVSNIPHQSKNYYYINHAIGKLKFVKKGKHYGLKCCILIHSFVLHILGLSIITPLCFNVLVCSPITNMKAHLESSS